MPIRQFSRPDMTRTEKEAEALQNVLGWLNPKQKQVTKQYVTQSADRTTARYRNLRMMLSFCGIDSYWGARAYFRHLTKH